MDAIRLLLLALALGACATPTPTPDPPPTPTPSPSADLFDGAVVECSSAATPAPIDQVRTCLDAGNTAECLVALVETNTPSTIACTVRALVMGLHIQINKGVSNETMRLEAKAGDEWIRAKKIGYR